MRKVVAVLILFFLFAAAVWLLVRPDMPDLLAGSIPTKASTAEPPPVIQEASDSTAIVDARTIAPSPRVQAQVDQPSTPTPQPTQPADATELKATTAPTSTRDLLSAEGAGLKAIAELSPTAPVSATSTTAATKAAVTLVPIPEDPIDRTCPNPSPAKPEYARYYLDSDPWPLPNLALGSHFWLAKPLPGGGRFLTQDWFPYGHDGGGRYLLHNGVDAAEPLGTPVLAVGDGTVVLAGSDADRYYGWRCDWYGHLVVVELDRRWQQQPVYALYGHVLNISVQPGQRVVRGQQVAEVGFGGAATAPHLHFELRVGTNSFGATRNPLLWIQLPSTRGLIAGRLLDPQGRPWQGVTVTAVGRSEGTANRTTWTYLDDPQSLINPDEGLAENFVIDDLVPGQYEIWAKVQGVDYRAQATVSGGQMTTVELRTEAYKTPTPAPQPTADP